MPASDMLVDLASRGRYHFTTQEAMEHLGSSPVATRAALRRLRKKGALATPLRGFHLIVPPEYRSLGCFPGDQFIPQIMEHLGLDYYVCLLSAARYHGAAHQQPQIFQVMVERNRPSIECGGVRVSFVARHNVGEIPTVTLNTPRGTIDISSPEATAIDLVGYHRHVGGLERVAAILGELSEVMDGETLASVAQLSPLPWSQRLGHLLERVGEAEKARPLAGYIERVAYETVPLVSSPELEPGLIDTRWRLMVNISVEPEL